MNRLKTTLLLSLLTVLMVAMGSAIGGMMALFSTHPPMEEHIARLESLSTVKQSLTY